MRQEHRATDALGFQEIEILTEAFCRAVLREFVRRERLDPDAAHSMLAWPHSGFHVHHSVRLEADDTLGMLQLTRYVERAPVALDQLQQGVRKKRVRFVPDSRQGSNAGTHDLDPLESLALLLAHSGRLPEVARLAGISKATVYEWRDRFSARESGGVEAPKPRTPGGRPPS